MNQTNKTKKRRRH